MIAAVSVEEYSKENDYRYALLPFYKNGEPLQTSPHWGMTLRSSGSMRFRWNDINENRDRVLSEIAGNKEIVPLELIHSKTVYAVDSARDVTGLTGDGLVTRNPSLFPVVTVADCMPLFLYDQNTGAFGVVHSGWKGTGIVGNAVSLMKEKYNALPENISVAIGAHIRSCCYIIDSERAQYFNETFGKGTAVPVTGEFLNSVRDIDVLTRNDFYSQNKRELFSLSLEKANLNVLASSGIREENIVVARECTCSNERFGSFRREAAFSDAPDKSKAFTVQAAFVRF